MNIYDNIKNVELPALENNLYYIYILENEPQHNIKIGITTNIQQRITSLSGSNSGGNHIIRCAVSEPTYLYTLERILHNRFKDNRIDGTEWFSGENISFEMACDVADEIFASDEYIKCNNIRKDFCMKQEK